MSAAGQWRGGLCVPEVRYAGGEGGGCLGTWGVLAPLPPPATTTSGSAP